MADPLGLIGNTAGGVGGVGSTPRGPTPEPGGPSFKDVLMENLKRVNELQQEATAAAEDLQSGKRTDVEHVLLATQKADTAFRALQAVRNKVIQAYEEIQQIRV